MPDTFWLDEYEKKAALPDALAQTGRGNTFQAVEFLYVARQMVELLELRPESHVLDVGCANGLFDILLSGACRSVLAVEPVTALAELARQNLGGCPNVRVEVGHGGRIPAPDRHFDRVLMLGVLQLVAPEEVKGIFRELRRVTKPGGRLLVASIPDSRKKQTFLEPYLAGVREALHLTENQKHQIITRNEKAFWYDYEELAQWWQALGGQSTRHALGAFDPDANHRFHLKVAVPG